MSGNLNTRIFRLEAKAGVSKEACPKFVRLVTSDEEEREVYREAAEIGLDTSPESTEIFVIRIIGGARRHGTCC